MECFDMQRLSHGTTGAIFALGQQLVSDDDGQTPRRTRRLIVGVARTPAGPELVAVFDPSAGTAFDALFAHSAYLRAQLFAALGFPTRA